MKKDKEILEAIRNGNDKSALSHLYQHTLAKVRSYIIKNNGNKEEADDIFQDSVVIFYYKVKNNQFQEGQSIDGFIYTVARNLYITKMRKAKRMRKYQEFVEQTESELLPDHLSYLINREKSAAMQKIFRQLDEKCQKMLKYTVYYKMSMREISEKMGHKNENVSKAQHYRCKQYLARLVKGNKQLFDLLGT